MRNDNVPAWLENVGFFTIDLGLDRMRELLERLNSPEKDLRFIHAAGSNGKGSVCVFTEQALLNSGYRTGFYSSPHLISLGERFRVNGKTIDDESLRTALEIVRPHVEAMRQEGHGPTYFEITTAVALVIFVRAKVDFVVWETGLGGRLDATNVVPPMVSVITGISLEHTAYLGNTLGAIAGEKAGIIKAGVPVVIGPMPPEAENVIRAKAEEMGAPLTVVPHYHGRFQIEHLPDQHLLQTVEIEGRSVRSGMIGAYQRDNIMIAAEVVKILSEKIGFDFKKAVEGFVNAQWPARFQVIPEKKLIIDGAHNPGGAEALAQSLREVFPATEFHFISGAFSDKDSVGVLSSFAPLALDFSFIAFDGAGRNVRSAVELGNVLAQIGARASWKEADLDTALRELPHEEWTVLTGSLHLCGEVLEKLGKSL